MKKLWMIAAALLILVGCGSKTTESKDYVKIFNDALSTSQKADKFDMSLAIQSDISKDMKMTMEVDIKGEPMKDTKVIPEMMMRLKMGINQDTQEIEMYAHDKNVYMKGKEIPALMIDQETFLAAGGFGNTGMDFEAIMETQPKITLDQEDIKKIEVTESGSSITYRFDSTKTDLVEDLFDDMDAVEGLDQSRIKNAVIDIVIKDGVFYQMLMEANPSAEGSEAKMTLSVTMNAIGDAVKMDFPDFSEYKSSNEGA